MGEKNIKQQLEAQRATFKLNMLAGFRKIPQVKIPEIPKERTLFPGTKDDYWYLLETPITTDCTVCIYELGKGGVFDPHFHMFNDEQCIILTKGGILEVITTEKEYEMSFPHSCFFKKGLKHAIVNKSDFRVELMVVWKPRMMGWNAEFINKEINK